MATATATGTLTSMGFYCPPEKFGGVAFMLFKAELRGVTTIGATPEEALGKLATAVTPR
jgi:hypothetical protein